MICRITKVKTPIMESNTSYNCSMQTVSHLQNWFVWLVNNASRNLCLIILFVLYISCLGIRQEQDLYVRLIDSATKQVILAHRSLNIHKPLQKYQLYSRLNLTGIVLVRFQIRGKKVELINMLRLAVLMGCKNVCWW